MKTSLFVITIFAISLMSCGGGGQAQENLDTPHETQVNKVANTQAARSQSSEAEEANSSETNNWNSVLDDYEEFVDDYIKLLKKANEGDLTAMTQYMEVLEKATTLSEKLENASDDLNVSQMNRFAKIQTKITNAALDMM